MDNWTEEITNSIATISGQEKVMSAMQAIIELKEAELTTAKERLTAYEITVKNLEAKLEQSDEALLSIGDKLTAKCRDIDLLKSSLPKIKADAVLSLLDTNYTCETPNGDSAWSSAAIERHANQLNPPKIESTPENWENRLLGADERYVAVSDNNKLEAGE